MKKIKRSVLCLTICVGMALSSIARADVVLEYLVKGINVPSGTTQNIAIKNEQIMVKAVGGDKNVDILYRHAAERVVIIDHRKGTLMTVDEQQVDRINQQAQNVEPLVQGLGEEIAKLSPDQRQSLQALLGGTVSLDMIAKAAEPSAPTRLAPAGMRKVGDIRCQVMRVMQRETPVAEICLADAALMKISDNDAATVRAFFRFYERLAAKSQGLSQQLGLALPDITAREVTGIPVEFRDLSGKDSVTVTLRCVNPSIVSPELMRIPSDYQAVPLALWQ